MRNAPGDGAPFARVPYGRGEIDFMIQPTFGVETVETVETVDARSGPPYDIAIAGVGHPDDATLAGAVRAAIAVSEAGVVRQGGVIIVPAQLEDGEGDGIDTDRLAAARARHLIVVAASEAPEAVRLARLRPAVDVEEALDIAHGHVGNPPLARVLLVRRAPPPRHAR